MCVIQTNAIVFPMHKYCSQKLSVILKYLFLLWLTVIIYRVFYCWFPKVFSACWGSNRLVPSSKLVPPIIDGDRDVRTGKLEKSRIGGPVYCNPNCQKLLGILLNKHPVLRAARSIRLTLRSKNPSNDANQI